MGKHSKKRRRDSSSSSEHEYVLKKELKRIKKQLNELDRRSTLHLTRTDSSPQDSPVSKDRFDNDVYDLTESEIPDERVDVFEDDENCPPPSELDQAVLSILGYDTKPNKNITPPFQKEVAISWTNILQKGLEEEERAALLKKYTPPENCALLGAPKLNLEVSSVIRESVARRDTKMITMQNQIGSALSALGQLLTALLKEEDVTNNMPLVQLTSDASRLLLDFHHNQTKSGRELIALDLKKEAKETLSNVQVDGWLFGDKLGERLKASKEVERSGLDLRPTKPKIVKKHNFSLNNSQASHHLNARRPPRQQGDYQGGRRQVLQNPSTNRVRKSYQDNKRGKRDPYQAKNTRGRFY